MSIPETSFFPAQRFPFFLCGFDMKCLQINFILVGLSIDNFEILSLFPVLVFLRMKEIFKIRQKFVKKSLGERTKEGRARWQACPAGGCGEAENPGVPEPLLPGTGAIRRERLIRSLLSAPQAQGVRPFACPGRSGSGTPDFLSSPQMPAGHACHRTRLSFWY